MTRHGRESMLGQCVKFPLRPLYSFQSLRVERSGRGVVFGAGTRPVLSSLSLLAFGAALVGLWIWLSSVPGGPSPKDRGLIAAFVGVVWIVCTSIANYENARLRAQPPFVEVDEVAGTVRFAGVNTSVPIGDAALRLVEVRWRRRDGEVGWVNARVTLVVAIVREGDEPRAYPLLVFWGSAKRLRRKIAPIGEKLTTTLENRSDELLHGEVILVPVD